MADAVLRFGACRLDVGQRQLWRDGKPQHLPPKAFDMLHLLVDARPRVVSKSELLSSVWREAFVSEVNLPVLVTEIRRAIGDSSREPKLLKTHHGVGYSFTADVRLAPSRNPLLVSPRYLLRVGNGDIELPDGDNIVGRERGADIVLKHASISRRHAKIAVSRTTVVVEDLDSKNGVLIGGKRIEGPTPVQPGDSIVFGSVETELIEAEKSDSTETVST